MGIYKLWAGLVRPAWVNWALLPGTIVSEMAYIFGCLITGGEIRRAKLMDSGGGKGAGKGDGAGSGAPATEATPKLKFIGPTFASLLAIIACGVAIVLVNKWLGGAVIEPFKEALSAAPSAEIPKFLPESWPGFWDEASRQIYLIQRTCETWGQLAWSNWRVPLFVYLAACLSIRLAPAKREVRAMLAAVVLVAGGIAAAGLISTKFDGLIKDLWPLLSYVWASLLFLLTVTLLIRAVVSLVLILAGKNK